METFFSIIGLFALIFFVKFIYDTYLTNNTDREWAKYKLNCPEDAARIENGNSLYYSSKPNIRDKVETKSTITSKTKNNEASLVNSSFFESVAGRETYQEIIHHIEYIKSKEEPNNKVKGHYLIYTMESLDESIGFVPADVIHSQAEEFGVKDALHKIIGTEVFLQFEPVGSVLNNGVVVDETHKLFYISYAKFLFSEYMLTFTTKIEKGIEFDNRNIEYHQKTNLKTKILNIDEMNIEMIYVKGGTFLMGSNKGEIDEMPTHNVTLNDFYISKYVITQFQWEFVMGYNPSIYIGDNFPLDRISLWGLEDFLLKLNDMSGENYRLPTEAEWEFAAKGGTKSCGFIYAGSDTLDNVAWYNNNSNRTTHEVGGKQPNELGLYDMSGNIGEWCNDFYCEYNSNSQFNPKGPLSADFGVIRGGDCFSLAADCRVSARYYDMQSNVSSPTGFRIVLDLM